MGLGEPSFAIAVRCHQSGDFRRAVSFYRVILCEDPHQAGILRLSRIACHQQGDANEATTCIRRPIRLAGLNRTYHHNKFRAVIGPQGRPVEVEGAYRKTLAIRLADAEAMSNLPALLPRPGVHNNLGNAQRVKCRETDSFASSQQAVAPGSASAEAHLNTGIFLRRTRQANEAAACLAQASRLRLGRAARCVGRYVLSCYGRMGLEDWVPTGPEEYVALAVKLGGEREYGEGCRAELARRREVLFEDVEVVREYERFFEEAVERARQETG